MRRAVLHSFICLLALAALLCWAVPAYAAGAQEASAPSDLARRAEAAQQDIRSRQVGCYGMVPVYGQDVADGVYPIQVDSSSVFFRIIDAELTVKDHRMTARLTISSLSYRWLYPGTAEQAKRDKESSYVDYEEVDGHGVFTFPVEALDKGVDCAAFSKKKQRWYDRTLVFYASSLPPEALSFELPDYELIEAAVSAYAAQTGDLIPTEPEQEKPQDIPQPVSLPRSDGEYSIEVNMTGGSGRASISSPTLLIVREGKAFARLLWSSTYYDYMIIGDQYFYNLSDEGGNSTFEIPITVLDEPMPVIADTTAMGEPVEISYALTFYEESIGEKGQIPQEAAKKVLLLAGAIIAVGGVVNHFVKKKWQ